MKIKETAEEIYKTSVEKGWWENTERNFGEIIALCHSELSEALEAQRSPVCASHFYWEGSKPEGWSVELIDCIIRIFDFLKHKNIDIEFVLRQKMDYNKTRPYKHGKKF